MIHNNSTLDIKFEIYKGSVFENGNISIYGISKELESKDIPHTIIWEFVNNEWKRYQWKNRTYDLITFEQNKTLTTIYMGFNGELKIRNQTTGSTVEVIDSGSDSPSSLRSVSSIAKINDYLFIVGMRRMIYRRHINSCTWEKFDESLRLKQNDLFITGLDSIDGFDLNNLFTVGWKGEIWNYNYNKWIQINSPTEEDLLIIRCLPNKLIIIGGKNGTLFVNKNKNWIQIKPILENESFTDIKFWNEKYFITTLSGNLYQLFIDELNCKKISIEIQNMKILNISVTSEKVYFFSNTIIYTLNEKGWNNIPIPVSNFN